MTEQLQNAIHAVQVRFGDQALLHGSRLPAVEAWPSGFEPVDRLSGIGGLPRGRLTLLTGPSTCGKLSLGLELLARASRGLSQIAVIDPARCFDPSSLAAHDADLDRVVVIRPPSADACGEAALMLARAGCGLVLLLLSGRVLAAAGSWLTALEGSASRSGTVLVAVAEEAPPALAHSSSFTLGLERADWLYEAGSPAGLRSSLRCLKNRVGAPGASAAIEMWFWRPPPAAEVGWERAEVEWRSAAV